MEQARKVALVTGANKGIGLAIATQLGALGYTVLIGARNADLGAAAAAEMVTRGIDARFLPVDLKDEASIAAAAKSIAADFGHLDALVNNAAVKLENYPSPPSQCPLSRVRETYETNVFGTLAVIQAMLPLLLKAPAGRIVNLSSGMGSMTLATTPGSIYQEKPLLSYCSSKAALNSITVQFAGEFKDTALKVNAFDPGFTATDMTRDVVRPSGFGRTPAQAAVGAVRLATLPADGPSGGFFNEKGALPW